MASHLSCPVRTSSPRYITHGFGQLFNSHVSPFSLPFRTRFLFNARFFRLHKLTPRFYAVNCIRGTCGGCYVYNVVKFMLIFRIVESYALSINFHWNKSTKKFTAALTMNRLWNSIIAKCLLNDFDRQKFCSRHNVHVHFICPSLYASTFMRVSRCRNLHLSLLTHSWARAGISHGNLLYHPFVIPLYYLWPFCILLSVLLPLNREGRAKYSAFFILTHLDYQFCTRCSSTNPCLVAFILFLQSDGFNLSLVDKISNTKFATINY